MMSPDDKIADFFVSQNYQAKATFTLPIENKRQLESNPTSDMSVAMLTRKGKTSIRVPPEDPEMMVHEYRRIHGLNPIEYPNAETLMGRTSYDIQAFYEVHGVLNLPQTAVVRAQAGAAPVINIRMTPGITDRSILKIRTAGTSPMDGRREFNRAMNVMDERRVARGSQTDNNSNQLPPQQPCGSLVKQRDGDHANHKGGRRGGRPN